MATSKSSSKVKHVVDATPVQDAPVSKNKPAAVETPKAVVAKRAKAKASTPVAAKKTAEIASPLPKAKLGPQAARNKAAGQKTTSAQPAAVAAKPVKDKLVRDSFTMPRSDFALIDQLKEKALGFKRPTKKSELLRAGLHVLAGLSDAKLKAALSALVPLKLGRPPRDEDQPAS